MSGLKTATPPREQIELYIKTSAPNRYQPFVAIIQKMSNLSKVSLLQDNSGIGPVVVSYCGMMNSYCLPNKKSDPDQDRAQLEKELEYTKGFLAAVEKKLGNQRFVENAPDQVVKK